MLNSLSTDDGTDRPKQQNCDDDDDDDDISCMQVGLQRFLSELAAAAAAASGLYHRWLVGSLLFSFITIYYFYNNKSAGEIDCDRLWLQ